MNEKTQEAVFLEYLRDSVPTIKAVSAQPRKQLLYIREDLHSYVARGVTAKSIWLDLNAIGIGCHYKSVVSALKAMFPDIYQTTAGKAKGANVASASSPVPGQSDLEKINEKPEKRRMSVEDMAEALSDYTGKKRPKL
ncbi:hypothetical protein MHM84_20225 [Halomonas sp. McH1-25]|uniref:hypothetical protein n=1 Tax=unclassified Halomonas TaxID=2609666 RepID=UPI001EF53A09|nr:MULTISPECIES: hypothetical protein [unclassified Halomonas]MCG7602072.1 hypothetical protein [Halomonas sp. McH1-25]MCP1342908.1 hypothetical protein [Halomonas sp. FL8]MCP1362527.1 hypothetical protein [Halomonas sp. BBD45]MCP1363957.1 hypothetical protein [Halomonas sp. BBD48]